MQSLGHNMNLPPTDLIPLIQQKLHQHYGPLNWWPADSPFEVAVGTILTQNTAWTNVEYAISNLREEGVLHPEGIARTTSSKLEELIKPSGFFRQKAARLQYFSSYLLERWQGDLGRMCSGSMDEVRNRLLALPGVGPETADSIMLYAAGRASFVVDAYTRRTFQRIGLLDGTEGYEDIRALFMQNLDEDAALFNEYHAQIVTLAKNCCRKNRPLCQKCPLIGCCRYAGTQECDCT